MRFLLDANIPFSSKEILKKFYQSQAKSYRQELDKLVKKLVGKYGMNLLLDLVIFHREFQKRKEKGKKEQGE